MTLDSRGMDENELKRRQRMIDAIEGHVGIWKAVWNEWPTEEIQTLWDYVTVPSGAPLSKS